MLRGIEVKICGLTDLESMDAALKAGSDMVGLMFFEPSPRNVSMPTAARLRERARGRARVVALTVDADDELIDEIVRVVQPDDLQFHGSETPERLAGIKARTGRRILKSIGVDKPSDLDRAAAYRQVADRLLFDAKPGSRSEQVIPGGNGVAFDWALLEGIPTGEKYLLAGGLTPENVGEALRATGAPGVDVSSGVERERGVKDPDRIRAFVKAVRQHGAQA